MLQSILNRLKEPSTYAGLSGILSLVGIQLPDGILEHLSYALAGVAGIISILLPEKLK